MKTMIKLTVGAILVAVMISGCAVKSEDSTGMKALKHTLNSPMYVLIGAGAAVNVVGNTVKKTVTGATNKLMGTSEEESKKDNLQDDESTLLLDENSTSQEN